MGPLRTLQTIPVLLLTLFFNAAQAQKTALPSFTVPITCLDIKVPFTFSWVDYDALPDDVPEVAQEKVKEAAVEFALESSGGDSTEIPKAEDYYFNTLRAPYNGLQLYIVIMKTRTFKYTHCKIFLYDSVHNTVSKRLVDYNTWSMYYIDDNSVRRSELFKSLHVESDDIIPQKGKTLLLKRVKNNGVKNMMEETVYRTNGVSLDTVSCITKPIYVESKEE